MPFDPSVGDVIRLFGEEYSVQDHPNAPGMPFAAEAGRATVYQVKDKQGRAWALKVFFPNYRTPLVLESSKHLRTVETYEGLMAASRRIVTPDEGDARKYRELHYAVLMRWVPGRTWYDLLEMVGTGKVSHTLPEARQLTSRFLRVIEQLESSGIAHTDISAGNVTVEQQAKETQLLDLEDMYLPQGPRPLVTTPGTPGYSHPHVKSTWQKAGDRYASAVLAAELLVMSDRNLAKEGTSNGYFTGNRDDARAQSRFQTAEPYLHEVAPGFCKLFTEAWTSDSLRTCPRIGLLNEAARRDWSSVIVPTPAGGSAAEPDDQDSAAPPAASTDRGRIWFEPDDKVHFETGSLPTSRPTVHKPRSPQPKTEPATHQSAAPKSASPAPKPASPAPIHTPQPPKRTSSPRVRFETDPAPTPPKVTVDPAPDPTPDPSPMKSSYTALKVIFLLFLGWLVFIWLSNALSR